MEPFVIEFNFANEIPASHEDNAGAARITRKNASASPLNERNWRPIAVEELGHSAERIPRKSELGERRVEAVDAAGSGDSRERVTQPRCT